MSSTPHSALRPPQSDGDPPPTIVVLGPGVAGEEPSIHQATLPTVRIPPSSRRRLVESTVLFVSAILFLRAVTVEPFGVPTGSMSPTLIGNHRALACYRCAYPVKVGEPANKANPYPETHCPNCGAINQDVANAPDVAGDRLLVDKNTFRLRSPRRWEVAVFICPSDKSKPYVKRVVGRPNEQIQLFDGDVWIDGKLARKTLAEVRECKIPIFDADFAPPGGWGNRWVVVGQQPLLNGTRSPLPEWVVASGGELTITAEGSDTPRLIGYWHVSPDSHATEVIRDGFEYNGHGGPSWEFSVHDLHVEFEVEVRAGQGAVVCKLTDGGDEATAQLAVGGEFGESKLLLWPVGLVKTANRPPLVVGKKYRVEMAIVDRRISVAVDGTEYFTYDLPDAGRRADLTNPFKIGAQGASVVIRHVKLSRDIYYRTGDRNAAHRPFPLGPDEYFLLGDNSANSDDSRSWQIPAVPERNFLGKPFLLHQPSRPGSWGVGQRRVETSAIDWGRIRWLR